MGEYFQSENADLCFYGLGLGLPTVCFVSVGACLVADEGVDLATIGLFSLILLPSMEVCLGAIAGSICSAFSADRLDADYASCAVVSISGLAGSAQNSVGLIAWVCVIVAFFQRVRILCLTLIAVKFCGH